MCCKRKKKKHKIQHKARPRHAPHLPPVSLPAFPSTLPTAPQDRPQPSSPNARAQRSAQSAPLLCCSRGGGEWRGVLRALTASRSSCSPGGGKAWPSRDHCSVNDADSLRTNQHRQQHTGHSDQPRQGGWRVGVDGRSPGGEVLQWPDGLELHQPVAEVEHAACQTCHLTCAQPAPTAAQHPAAGRGGEGEEGRADRRDAWGRRRIA